MYGSNVSADFLGHVVDALTPYPRGAVAIFYNSREIDEFYPFVRTTYKCWNGGGQSSV